MTRLLTSLSVAALALFTVVHPAPTAAQPASPIAIQSCTVLEWRPIADHPFWNPFGVPHIVVGTPITDGIEIVYVNTAPVVADRVVFAVNYRGEVERITDAGTFSPNAKIDHTFTNFSGQAFEGPRPNYCRVALVRFVDGTVWRRVP
jgi:hypothetical protein